MKLGGTFIAHYAGIVTPIFITGIRYLGNGVRTSSFMLRYLYDYIIRIYR